MSLLDGITDGETSVSSSRGSELQRPRRRNGRRRVCYQYATAAPYLPDLRQRTPYAVVTNFVPMIKRERFAYSVVCLQILHRLKNFIRYQDLRPGGVGHAAAISAGEAPPEDGRGRRTGHCQFDNDRHVVGLRTPIYGRASPGAWLPRPFIGDERVQGGHVVDFKLRSAKG